MDIQLFFDRKSENFRTSFVVFVNPEKTVRSGAEIETVAREQNGVVCEAGGPSIVPDVQR